MRKWLSIVLYVIGGLVAIGIITIVIANKPLPEGNEGVEASKRADEMLAAVNLPAWESLRYVGWSFRGGTSSYTWDRWYDLADIRWGDNRVLLNLNNLEGRAWSGDEQLSGQDKRKKIQKAWEMWCNDSFWLNPVVKVRDDGVELKAVDTNKDEKGLLVTFTQGGVTPGDSYLFLLDDYGMPYAWQMWTSVLPVKGLRFNIEDWASLDGALVPVQHSIGPVSIGPTDVRSGDHHSDLGLERDPFTDF